MFRSVLIGVISGLFAIFITGCNHATSKKDWTQTGQSVEPSTVKSCGAEVEADQKIKLDLIQQLMDKGSLFAALAHLDALRSNSPQAVYLRAEILRQTNRTEQAVSLYRGLLRSCLAGKGYHGLGLISGRENNVAEALDYLKKAAHELPLDVRVRNDFGYALLLDKQYQQARNEFMTALELSGGDALATTNMALLLLVTGKEKEMQSFASHMKIDEEAMQQLRSQAEKIKTSNEGLDVP